MILITLYHENEVNFIAQLAEHWTSKPKVAGSFPTVVKQNVRLTGVYSEKHHQHTPEYMTLQNITLGLID